MKLIYSPVGTNPKSPNGLPFYYPYPQHLGMVLSLSGILFEDGVVSISPHHHAGPSATLKSIPDEWVIQTHGQRPAVGKESGHEYWSRIGFDANYDKIKEAWERQHPTIPFANVEKEADEFYKTLAVGATKLEKELNKKLAEIAAARKLI